MKRKALGKGLSSLIPEAPKAAPTATLERAQTKRSPLRELDLDLIVPNPDQPRREFDAEALASLAHSLNEQGVLQPILVREIEGGRFEIVSGERRWRAAQLAGMMKIPALVRPIEPDRRLEYALIENLQREDLNPLEVAESYRRLMDEFNLTLQEVAERVGRPRATVSNSIRLLSLPQAVQRKITAGTLTAGHAKALLGLERAGRQADLAERAVKRGLSVRQLEKLVASERSASPVRPVTPPARDPNVEAAEARLQRALGTKVRIVAARKGGRIEIHCFSQEELDKFYELLLKATN